MNQEMSNRTIKTRKKWKLNSPPMSKARWDISSDWLGKRIIGCLSSKLFPWMAAPLRSSCGREPDRWIEFPAGRTISLTPPSSLTLSLGSVSSLSSFISLLPRIGSSLRQAINPNSGHLLPNPSQLPGQV